MLAPLVRWIGPTVREVEADARRFRESEAGRKPDFKTVWVLLAAAVCLTVQNYAALPQSRLNPFPPGQLNQLLWWAVVAYATYVLVPMLVIWFALGERVRDYGVKLRGFTAGWPVYLAFVAVMAPLVWAFSASDHFQATYPFYRPATRADVADNLPVWEVAYAGQFLALEFFFRGFLVHGLKHRLGVYAVFAMTVPYCMLHFQKPPAECAGSIVAGVALGFMSLKTRSVWLGAALHVSVAWGMDAAALYRRGLL